MKSRTKALEARLAKLERGHLPVPSYVVRLSHDEQRLSAAEQRMLIRERSGGRPVAVMPAVCATSQEWIDLYAKPGLARATH
jgi:hypothetical protein